MGTPVIDAASDLRGLLRTSTATADEQWRRWADRLMEPGVLSPQLLAEFWREIRDFDDVLAGYIENPLAVPERTVIVAGSGKETFKTFNVSTAASILAVSAGARVVKGVSRSVSAVSGAADVLSALGIRPVAAPREVPQAVHEQGVAFVSYAAFCPGYAGRYDSVFPRLSPFSFFMPVAVVGVLADGFLHGLAHPDVALSRTAIGHARPELRAGTVVSTMLETGETMDERAPFGTNLTACLQMCEGRCYRQVAASPPSGWRRSVAQRGSHRANAAALADSLAPRGSRHRTGLVEINAAVILQLGQPRLTAPEALGVVKQARLSGAAGRLLSQLRHEISRASR